MQMRLASSFVGILVFACGAETTTKPSVAPAPAPAAHRPVEPAPGLEVEQIRPVVEAKNGEVRGCHTIEYAGRDNLGGTMTVDLFIEPDGTVRSASVAHSDFESEPMQKCVIDVTRRLQFPSAEGSTDLSWRFRFQSPRG
jgi:hypothetical protein